MSIKSELVGGLLELEGDLDNPVFVWKGVEVPCIPGGLARGAVLQVGGIMVEFHLVLTVRRALWVTADSTETTADDIDITADANIPGPRPLARNYLEFEGVQYKVEHVLSACTKSHINIYLTDPNR